MEFLLWLLALAVFGAGSYFLIQHLDRKRIHDHLHSRGDELLSLELDPFGPGWIGERDSQIYQVTYRDRNEKVHRAYVKTSILSGVYFTEDTVVGGDVDLDEVRKKLRNSWLERKDRP